MLSWTGLWYKLEELIDCSSCGVWKIRFVGIGREEKMQEKSCLVHTHNNALFFPYYH